MRILYVENHAVFAATVTRKFLSNHSVTVVPSLALARKAFTDQRFDVLLVDFDLDDGKGDALAREIHDKNPHITIIGVSSHDEGNKALRLAGAKATGATASLIQRSRVTINSNGEEQTSTAVSTWTLTANGSELTGTVQRAIEGMPMGMPAAPVTGKRM